MSIIYAEGNTIEKSITERFWEKVDKIGKDKCWNWTGYHNSVGYGRMGDGNRGLILAHRLSWEIHFGPIPIGKLVLHKCDNPKCINPNHLYIGTYSDNNMDRAKRNPNNQGGRPKAEKGVNL